MTQQSAVHRQPTPTTGNDHPAQTSRRLNVMRRSDASSRLLVLVGLFEEIYEKADYQYRHSSDEVVRLNALRLKFDVLRQLSQLFDS